MKEADTLREEVEKLRAKVGELEGQVKDGEAATKKAEAAAEAAKAKADAMTQAAGEFLLVWGAAAAASGRRSLAFSCARACVRACVSFLVTPFVVWCFLLLLLFCFAVLFWPAVFFLPIWLVVRSLPTGVLLQVPPKALVGRWVQCGKDGCTALLCGVALVNLYVSCSFVWFCLPEKCVG